MEPGTQLGHRYQLTERVDSGRLGDMWHANDTIFERTVTVTVLHRHLSEDQQFRDAFRQNATAVARLDNPHIVELLDYSEEWRDGGLVTFVVTEKLSPTRLSEVLTHGPLSPERAVAIAAAIGNAIGTAHDAHIVHGRISPHTVAFRDDTPVLTDFGVADIGMAGNEDLPYLSPEQLSGDTPGSHSDLYALAALAYACATGRAPFTGATANEILDELDASGPPSPPSDCPSRIAGLISGALLRNPDDRDIEADVAPRQAVDYADADVGPQEPPSREAGAPAEAEATAEESAEQDANDSEQDEEVSETDGTAVLPAADRDDDGTAVLPADKEAQQDEKASETDETAVLPSAGQDDDETAVLPQANKDDEMDGTKALPVATAPVPSPASDEPADDDAVASSDTTRKRRGLIVLGAVVVLIVALLFVHPWQYLGGTGDNESDTSPAASGSSSPSASTRTNDSPTDASPSPRATTKAPPPNNPTRLPEPTTSEPSSTVPDVVDTPPSEAEAILSAAEYNVARSESGAGRIECAVLMQSPEAGERAEPGSTVTIWYFRVHNERFCRGA